MLANFSDLFDSLLIIAGLALVVTGLVMFIRSKSSTDASSVEAFGIKLNVTHPSLILVLAGVGLMLAPRLLPDLPGKGSTPEPTVVTEAAKAEPITPPVTVRAPETASTPNVTALSPQVVSPKPQAPVVSARPTKPQVTPVPAPVEPRIIASATPTPAPAARVTQAAKPKPVVTETRPKPAQVAITRPPPATSQPAEDPVIPKPPTANLTRPTLAYAALGLPTSHGFWSGETRTGYTGRMHTTLQQAGQDVLRMNASGLNLNQAAFDAWWKESNQHPRSRELCAAPNAPRALLAARVETSTVTSSVESAYWPELKLRLFICANQKEHRQQKTLSPQNADVWPFATELNSEIERFMRTYRGDLAE